MWFRVPDFSVTWIILGVFYPHPTGNRLLTRLTLSAVEFCLVRSWSVSAGRPEVLTVPPLTDPGFSTALVPILLPLDTIQSQSSLIFPTPTLQHHLRTNESCYCPFFLFILVRPLTFRLWCGSYVNWVHLSYFFSKPLHTFYVKYFPTCFYHFHLVLP